MLCEAIQPPPGAVGDYPIIDVDNSYHVIRAIRINNQVQLLTLARNTNCSRLETLAWWEHPGVAGGWRQASLPHPTWSWRGGFGTLVACMKHNTQQSQALVPSWPVHPVLSLLLYTELSM